MRPPTHDDAIAVARVLLPLPATRRAAALREILAAADRADRFWQETGWPDPANGDGTLTAAAFRSGRPPHISASDPEAAGVVAMVYVALSHRPAQPCVQDAQRGVAGSSASRAVSSSSPQSVQ